MSAILLLSPILLPVMKNVGISGLQFGAMMITGLAIGLVTPPVGMCLNACTKINKMSSLALSPLIKKLDLFGKLMFPNPSIS